MNVLISELASGLLFPFDAAGSRREIIKLEMSLNFKPKPNKISYNIFNNIRKIVVQKYVIL